MIKDTILELKEVFLGKSSDNGLIKKVMEGSCNGNDFLSKANVNDSSEGFKNVCLAIICNLFRFNIDTVNEIKKEFLLKDDEINEIIELTFLFAEKIGNYDIMSYLVSKYDLKNKSLIKPIIELMRNLILKKKYENAAEILKGYKKDFVIYDKLIYDVLREEFYNNMSFKKTDNIRDYSNAFKFNQLLNLPKDITFQKAMDEFNFNFEGEKFYTAALIAKNFKLGEAIIIKSAYESFKQEIKSFKKNLEKNMYRNWKNININDSFFYARKILSEFGLYDVDLKKLEKENEYMRKIAETMFNIFLSLIDSNSYNNVNSMSKTYLAITIIKDYALNNDFLFPHIVKNLIVNSKKLVDNINEEVNDFKSGMECYELLITLRNLNILEYEYIDRIAQKIFIFSLQEKEIDIALKIYNDCSLRFDIMINNILNIIYEWSRNNDFDNIFIMMEKFPIKELLINNREFLENVRSYYEENLKENKLLKCLYIAEVFEFDRSQYIYSVKSLIDTNLKNKNLIEVKNLMKKYKVKKGEVSRTVKQGYFDMLKKDKYFAEKIREEFDLSIFEVGFLKWFLYEFLGIRKK